jgi:hypothetical protein
MWPHSNGRGIPRSQRWSRGRGGAGSTAVAIGAAPEATLAGPQAASTATSDASEQSARTRLDGLLVLTPASLAADGAAHRHPGEALRVAAVLAQVVLLVPGDVLGAGPLRASAAARLVAEVSQGPRMGSRLPRIADP